ncbi:phosphotransferase family protein [Tomitella biformata]|uniref:phosphotransferase family protein n=1 Tax=Tomitella biformata TaxID=630403 RepID=UPI000464043E|nr:phosphotransferase family protein [Tomitella biformata]
MTTESKHAELLADLSVRAARASSAWQPGLEIANVRPLTGGTSSLTFVADVTGGAIAEPVVLKVAPPGLAPVRNRDVIRQGRVMQALQGAAGVAAPAVYFEDAGSPPFVAMQMLAGECVEPLLSADRPRDDETRAQTRARYESATRMLAHLHAVDPADIGLGAEPVVSLGAEIDRWTRAFETVPDDLRGDYLGCAEALHATMPAPARPVVNHGDYRLGNTLCEGDAVTALIDWEIWSVGDPRVDLTWLAYFTDEAGHPAAVSEEPCGTPTIAEVVRLYEQTLGHEVVDIDWFHALTRYKEAAATALLIKRGRKTGGLSPAFLKMEPALPGLLTEALSLIGR